MPETETVAWSVGGVYVTLAQINEAIEILEAGSGSGVLVPLYKAAHPLKAADVTAVAKTWPGYDENQHTKGARKAAVISVLKAKAAEISALGFDENASGAFTNNYGTTIPTWSSSSNATVNVGPITYTSAQIDMSSFSNAMSAAQVKMAELGKAMAPLGEAVKAQAPAPISASDLFEADWRGWVTPVFDSTYIPYYGRDLLFAIKNIADKVGGGKVVGKGRSKLNSVQKGRWLAAWFEGDMVAVYELEKSTGVKLSDKHPGAPDNVLTHKIVWTAAVPTEVPAGQWINDSMLEGVDIFRLRKFRRGILKYLILVEASTEFRQYEKEDRLQSADKLVKEVDALISDVLHSGAAVDQKRLAKLRYNAIRWLNYPTKWLVANSLGEEQDYGLDNIFPVMWPSTDNSRCLPERIDNYVTMAEMAYPTYVSLEERRIWMFSHLNGDRDQVNNISLNAKRRYDQGFSPISSEPHWTEGLAASKTYEVLLPKSFEEMHSDPFSGWALQAIYDFVSDTDTSVYAPAKLTWDIRDRARPLLAEMMSTEFSKRNELVFRAAPSQDITPGTNRGIRVLVDQHDRQWVFKPAAEPFRAEVEHGAHLLAQRWGYPTATSKLIVFNGAYGQAQLRHDEKFNLEDFTAFSSLSQAELNDLAREHLLDWMLDNDDSHGVNLIRHPSGGIRGVDKGRAYKHFGNWMGLTTSTDMNTNAQLVYPRLYRAIARGDLNKEQIDGMHNAVMLRARRIQATPNGVMQAQLAAMFEHRPFGYGHGSYQSSVDLSAAIIARKNNIVSDMEKLWIDIYGATKYDRPDVFVATLTNVQGHPLYLGLSAELLESVSQTKSYGTAAFFDSVDIEDSRVLFWRERVDGHVLIRAETRVSKSAANKIEHWFNDQIKKHKIVNGVAEPSELPDELSMEPDLYRLLLEAAKTVSAHHEDKAYNTSRLRGLSVVQEQVRKIIYLLPKPKSHASRERLRMAELYLSYVKQILAAKEAGTKTLRDQFPQFEYFKEKARPVATKKVNPSVNVKRKSATRHRGKQDDKPALAVDGELDLISTTHSSGNSGDAYWGQLQTGETIEFRGSDSVKAHYGLLRITVPTELEPLDGLQRVFVELARMGLVLPEATDESLELFYWRHLVAIMRDRKDTYKISGYYDYKYDPFWAAIKADLENAGGPAELDMYRSAFAVLPDVGGSTAVTAFTEEGRHLPMFDHFDLRQPDMPNGTPYWERIDVTREMWQGLQLPLSIHADVYGASHIVQTGGFLSTEARMRTLGFWKHFTSNGNDQEHGSSGYIFTKLNSETRDLYEHMAVWFNPRVMARTTNYGFSGDEFGEVDKRRESSNWDFEKSMSHSGGSNETLVKDAISLLDGIELIRFNDADALAKALNHLRSLGIEQIRGVPIEQRFVRDVSANHFELVRQEARV